MSKLDHASLLNELSVTQKVQGTLILLTLNRPILFLAFLFVGLEPQLHPFAKICTAFFINRPGFATFEDTGFLSEPVLNY